MLQKTILCCFGYSKTYLLKEVYNELQGIAGVFLGKLREPQIVMQK